MTLLRTPEIPNLTKIRFSPLFLRENTPLETEINLQMPVRSGWNIFFGNRSIYFAHHDLTYRAHRVLSLWFYHGEIGGTGKKSPNGATI